MSNLELLFLSMPSPRDIAPPDDSGTDTFARYVYQAHVTFVFCLDAALGDEIDAVYAEHLEDIAAFQTVGPELDATYECHLEGALMKSNAIRSFATRSRFRSSARRCSSSHGEH